MFLARSMFIWIRMFDSILRNDYIEDFIKSYLKNDGALSLDENFAIVFFYLIVFSWISLRSSFKYNVLRI